MNITCFGGGGTGIGSAKHGFKIIKAIKRPRKEILMDLQRDCKVIFLDLGDLGCTIELLDSEDVVCKTF